MDISSLTLFFSPPQFSIWSFGISPNMSESPHLNLQARWWESCALASAFPDCSKVPVHGIMGSMADLRYSTNSPRKMSPVLFKILANDQGDIIQHQSSLRTPLHRTTTCALATWKIRFGIPTDWSKSSPSAHLPRHPKGYMINSWGITVPFSPPRMPEKGKLNHVGYSGTFVRSGEIKSNHCSIVDYFGCLFGSTHLPSRPSISQIRRLVHVQALAAASATDENAIIVAFWGARMCYTFGQGEAQALVNFCMATLKKMKNSIIYMCPCFSGMLLFYLFGGLLY